MPSRSVHLVRRFCGALWPGGPGRQAEAWVAGVLLPAEHELWVRLSGPDRRHAVGVARHAERTLGGSEAPDAPDALGKATRPVIAAALMHDVGKLAARLGTYRRVVATLVGAITRGKMNDRWVESSGFTRRVGLYLRHAPIGADMLAIAGSEDLTVTWTREHHLPPEEWTLEPDVAAALKAADDD